MKRCYSYFARKKKKLSSEKDIENLNGSSSKLEINKINSPLSKNTNDRRFDINENLDKNTPPSTLNKKTTKILTYFSQDKSLQSSNNIFRSRSFHHRISKPSINKYIPTNYKNGFCKCITDRFFCFFCGGKNCNVENYLKNPNQPNAIEGLNSNFITENIIAGQRLSDYLIKKFNLIEKFKQLNIGLIVNLQREGEHPFCGPNKLNYFGYSYNPSYFSGDDINVKFFGWKETKSSLSINFILEVVKIICLNIFEYKHKVYIHSHSGNGRTAVIIGCYLLFISNKKVDDVIKEISSKRKNSFENKSDVKNIKIFKNFLDDSRIIYGKKEKIDVYLKRQEDLLFGDEAKIYGYIPKIITRILEEIIKVKIKYKIDNLSVIKLVKGINMEWNNELENILFLLKKYLNKNDWSLFNANENLILFVELLFDFCEDSNFFIICPEKTDQLFSEELFIKFYGKNNFIQTKQNKVNLLCLIKKIYFGYEFAIIYQFAYFSANLYEKTTNEIFKNEFKEMIERFSLELQGYNLTQIHNIKDKDEYNKIELRVKVLAYVINFLILELLEPNNFTKNSNDYLSKLTPVKSISTFLSTCIKYKRNSNMMSNIDSILGRKNSTYYFEEESDNGISENECFKNEEDKILDRKKSNKSKIINKASSKKTLNILLNKKIISKEQSTLLSFKSINEGLFNSGNLLDIKKNMNNVNLSQRQNKKQFSFMLKSDDIIEE
jgi:hypothetical protein